jgi:hypothetical protein
MACLRSAGMGGGIECRCAQCGAVLEDCEAPEPCPTYGSLKRGVVVIAPTAIAYARAPVPTVRSDVLLDSVALAHAGIVLSLTSAVGFGVAAESGSAVWGGVAAVAVACSWCVVCKVSAVRGPVVRLVRWLATP